MLELGMFQHRMVESMPPLKHCSPVALTARLSTGPTWARNVYTGSTSSDAALEANSGYTEGQSTRLHTGPSKDNRVKPISVTPKQENTAKERKKF